ncbi:MAG: peptide ABC transporter substrate-binding protein [Oscillospiraceae bacterium]
MKKILSALLLIVMIFSFAGCNVSQKSYIVKYDILSEPKNLDPQTASDQASLTVINNIFEGLFYIDEFGAIQNGLAKSVIKSNGGLLYTIDIKNDIYWTNGDSVTANDFVFAVQRLLRSDTNSPAVSQFFSIKNAQEVNQGKMSETSLGVTALSEKKLQIELEYENDNLEYLFATTYAMPCNEKFFNQTKGKYGLQSEKIMSNGSFDIYSWKHGESIKLRKSESYYDAQNVKPTGVNLYISVEQTVEERLLDEAVNAAFVGGNDIEKFLKKGYNTEAIENATWGLYLNTKNESLSNENIRRAIAACFDRNSYKDKLQENLSIANGIIPHSIMMFDKTFRDYAGDTVTQEFNTAKSYEYYKTGLTNLNKQDVPVLKLLINKDAKVNAVEYFSYPSQIFQKELSLYINIDEVDEKEYNRRIQAGDFDIALYKLASADNSVSAILSSFQSYSNKNFISYKNEKYDNLLTDTISKTQKLEIINGYKNAEQKLIDEAVFIPMFYTTDYFVCTGETSGIICNKRTGLISFKNAVIG